jgi:DNA-binding transcriptional LysR family regulator
MDRLDTMKVFVAVAEARGFAPAARRLGLSPPAVTRAVVALEARLGAQLLRRTTRSVALTEAGERFHADARRLLAELTDAEAAAGGAQREPQGQLAVTAPSMFGRLHVAPLLLGFMVQQPRVSVRCHFADQIVHLLDEGFDVAVRIAQLPDSGLSAVRVGELRRVVVASPAYIAEHGEPAGPQALRDHAAIGFTSSSGVAASWTFYPPGRKGRADGVAVQPRLRLQANTSEMAIAAALAGIGVTRVLSYQVAADVLAGRLRIVLAEHEGAPVPVQLVHAEGRRVAAKTRAFIDFAVDRLRREPVLNGTLVWP